MDAAAARRMGYCARWAWHAIALRDFRPLIFGIAVSIAMLAASLPLKRGVILGFGAVAWPKLRRDPGASS